MSCITRKLAECSEALGLEKPTSDCHHNPSAWPVASRTKAHQQPAPVAYLASFLFVGVVLPPEVLLRGTGRRELEAAGILLANHTETTQEVFLAFFFF